MKCPHHHEDTIKLPSPKHWIQIIDMKHPLVVLAQSIDWSFLAREIGAMYRDGPGYPPLPTRLMAGLHIIKYMEDLSDEEVCRRFVENPYYQYFCGEEFFQHELPLDRSSMTRWRQRLGEEKMQALLQESLATAVRLGAAKPSELTQVVVDTTVQEKNVAHPTDAKLIHQARERLVKLAKKHGLKLRQSYVRVGKKALIRCQRYRHAKQFKRANRELRKLKTWLGRVIRDIERQIAGIQRCRTSSAGSYGRPSGCAHRSHVMQGAACVCVARAGGGMHRQGQEPQGGGAAACTMVGSGAVAGAVGQHVAPSLPAPLVQFGVKVSVATTIRRLRGGQFVVHAMALPDKPHDGHTLRMVLPKIERLVGAPVQRVLTDAGYRGHKLPTHGSSRSLWTARNDT